jgi:hypothetical protein
MTRAIKQSPQNSLSIADNFLLIHQISNTILLFNLYAIIGIAEEYTTSLWRPKLFFFFTMKNHRATQYRTPQAL